MIYINEIESWLRLGIIERFFGFWSFSWEMLLKVTKFHRELFWAFFIKFNLESFFHFINISPEKLCRFFLLLTSTTNNDELNLKKIKRITLNQRLFLYLISFFRDVLVLKIKEKGKNISHLFLFFNCIVFKSFNIFLLCLKIN